MVFNIDENTLNDLDIFTASVHESSIFSIFNNCKTQGGIEVLVTFLQNPISDYKALKRRTEIIKFISENDLSLILNFHQFDYIEHYLKLSRIPLHDNILEAWVNHMSYKLKPSNNYYNIRLGIEQFIHLIKPLEIFLDSLKELELPQFLEETKEHINHFVKLMKKNKLRSPEKKLNFRDINKLDKIIRKKEKKRIREFLDTIYTLECYLSVSSTIKKYGFQIPEYDDSRQINIEIKSIFHPFLEEPIRNDIKLGEKENLCFLTGPNMAGKSTFLKSIGIAIYLAHLGFPVPAAYMKTTVLNGIITTINLADNINKGYSHYYSEVKRVKETVTEILNKKNVLVIFDELFRGTNVKDAHEASYKIIEKLTQVKDCLFFISTHINEVADKLEVDSICCKYFNSELKDRKPTYDYKLKDGISTERMGMQIIDNENIFKLLDEAILRQEE